MTPADLLTLKQLGPVAASPDGEWLAVVIARPRGEAEIYRDFPWGPSDADHADIWLLPRRGGEGRNITNGSLDASGYWSPVWSPDGRRLALLSTKGGDDIRPYVWDVKSGTLRRLTDRGFDMLAYGDEGWPQSPLIWVDSTTLICPLRPNGAPPTYHTMSKTRSMSVALDAWTRASRGKVPTASVLNSGTATSGPRGQLMAFDVVSGESRVIVQGNFFSLILSPTRRHLALIVEEGTKPPSPNRKLRAYRSGTEEWWHTRLIIVSLTDHGKPVLSSVIADPTVGRLSMLGDHPGAWSPDGSSFAVVVQDSAPDNNATTVFVVDVAGGRVQSLQDKSLEVQKTAWSREGQLLALGRRQAIPSETQDSTRWDWWVVNPRTMAEPRNLTANLVVAPAMLMPAPQSHWMLGLAKGDLWTIEVGSGKSINLTKDQLPDIDAIVWPARPQRLSQAQNVLVVRANNGMLYRVEWVGGGARTSPLKIPAPGAELAEFRPGQRLAVFTSAASNGVFLWSGDVDTGDFERRLALNEQLGKIADARRMLIEYRGIDGDTLKAVVLLPVGYRPGERYPLVSWVYPGTVVSDTIGHFVSDKHEVYSLNLNLLAAHGYAVLIPSMPLRPEGPPSEAYLDLPKGVMPAIDKVIDLGIADSERLGVMGHSYGGYGTYSLVSYTDRFKAAIALAGPSDLLSLYGTVPARYDTQPHAELFAAALAESGQNRMGVPPWEDAGRYLRNSPYYHVDRIRTPLMLIHGDLDYVPMQQGEQLFVALHRLGRKAQFVRYWGEGHIISSPANITDMWQRVFAWFDEHLQLK